MRFRNDKYVLNAAGDPVPEPDIQKWGRWFENTQQRVVKQERVRQSTISTVFLGLHHRFGDEGSPILWETMVFGGPLDQKQDRCGGYRAQAQAMHQRMVSRAKEEFGISL